MVAGGDAVTLDFITIPTAILKLDNLNLRQKLLLALVLSFNNKGFRLSNQAIGEILDIEAERVSKLLADIERKDYVRISNAQSRWRTIYLSEKAKVHFGEKAKVANSTLAFETGYFGEKAKHKLKKLKGTTGRTVQKPVSAAPPTETQVKDYATTQGCPTFDARYFVEHYAANDWRHKDAKPMLNWKQTVLTWLRRDKAREAAKPEPKRGDLGWFPTEEEAEAVLKGGSL